MQLDAQPGNSNQYEWENGRDSLQIENMNNLQIWCNTKWRDDKTEEIQSPNAVRNCKNFPFDLKFVQLYIVEADRKKNDVTIEDENDHWSRDQIDLEEE